MEGFTDENPDDFCLRCLEEGDPIELRKWLYDGQSTLGEIQINSASIALADAAYLAGAENIYGIDLEIDTEFGSNTGRLVVELSDDTQKRKGVLDWAAPIAHEQGFDAYTDVGQKYVYVGLD